MKMVKWGAGAAALALAFSAPMIASAQQAPRMERVPDRTLEEGEGPFRRLVIRGVTIVEGSGAPPSGPMDVVIEGNRIADIRSAGTPGLPLRNDRDPRDFDHEIDATGMFMLPGFVDTHGHNGDPNKAPNALYGYKLWLAHGVTTVRGLPFYFGRENMSLSDRERSAANTIVAPRLFAYMALGDGWDGGAVDTPEKARAWVRWAAAQGYDGVKLFNNVPPAVTEAATDEAQKHGLGTIAHLAQGGVAEINADRAGEIGVDSITHFYGHFESLLNNRRIPSYPIDYNMQDEQWRFGQIARLADQIVEPCGPEWRGYLERQLERGVTFNPTFYIYAAGRDVMRARNGDWHERYVLPSLQNFFQPSRTHHGSYFWDWTTADEIAWRRFYIPWMRLTNDYKNMGGRVTVGSDPGFIYQTWGFSYIGELEMLQEAGFSPLEVIRSATIEGAREIYEPKGEEPPFGLIREGMLADLVIVPENPLANLKLLYGTGHMRLNPQTQEVERAGGVRWTIKDGIVYDARELLEDVARMVEEQRQTAPDSH